MPIIKNMEITAFNWYRFGESYSQATIQEAAIRGASLDMLTDACLKGTQEKLRISDGPMFSFISFACFIGGGIEGARQTLISLPSRTQEIAARMQSDDAALMGTAISQFLFLAIDVAALVDGGSGPAIDMPPPYGAFVVQKSGTLAIERGAILFNREIPLNGVSLMTADNQTSLGGSPTKPTITQVIGEEIRTLRRLQRWTVIEFAKRIQVSAQRVTQIERGEAWGSRLYSKLESIFNLEANYFQNLETKLERESFPLTKNFSTAKKIRQSIGAVIARLRQSKGWKQGELAQQLGGIQKNRISSFERGRLSARSFYAQLERIFELEPSYFDRLEEGMILKDRDILSKTKEQPVSPPPSPESRFSSLGRFTELFERQLGAPIENIVFNAERNVYIVFTRDGALHEVTIQTKCMYRP